jgi:hypothetical protein
VTLVEQKPTVLRDWDPLVGQKISESLREAGVTMKTGYTFEPENAAAAALNNQAEFRVFLRHS